MMCFWLATWKALEASIVPVHMEASTSTIEASTSTIVQLQLHDFREYWLSNRARSRVRQSCYDFCYNCIKNNSRVPLYISTARCDYPGTCTGKT
jgi:hypothetical protein